MENNFALNRTDKSTVRYSRERIHERLDPAEEAWRQSQVQGTTCHCYTNTQRTARDFYKHWFITAG